MKRIIAILTLMMSVNAWADTWTDPDTGMTWTYTTNNCVASVGGGDYSSPAISRSTTGIITIPSSLGGCSVTSIAPGAFYCATNLVSVVIPDSVTNIGHCAFYGCANLKGVKIPNGVSVIFDFTFANCPSLEYIYLPDSITGIADNAFAILDNEVVTFTGDSVTVLAYSHGNVTGANGWTVELYVGIGDQPFDGCNNLKDVSMPCSVVNNRTISELFPSYQLLTNIVLTGLISVIPDLMFADCIRLKGISLPESVVILGNDVFKNCSSLKSIVFQGDAPDVGESVFSGTRKSLIVYVNDGSIGWNGDLTATLPSVWNGRRIVSIQTGEGGSDNNSGSSSTTKSSGSSITSFVGLADVIAATTRNIVDLGSTLTDVEKRELLYSNVSNIWRTLANIGNGTIDTSKVTKFDGVGDVIAALDAMILSLGCELLESEREELLTVSIEIVCGLLEDISDGTMNTSSIESFESLGDILIAATCLVEDFGVALSDDVRVALMRQINDAASNLLSHTAVIGTSYVYDPQYETSTSHRVASLASLTVTNIVLHYVMNSVPSEAVTPLTNSTGIVNVIAEVGAGEKPIAMTSEWTAQYPDFESKFGTDFTTAIMAKSGKKDSAGNDMFVWQDYVAGTDPTDENDVFTASITFDAETGEPVISWTPELTEAEAAKRAYKKYGKVHISDADWTLITEGNEGDYNFFKVTVEMK